MPLEVGGKTYETDEEGYLANLNDWSPEVAEALAKADDAELTENHWEVINFLREYYDEYQIAPAVRVKTRATASTCTNCSRMAQPSRLVSMPVCPSQPVAYNPLALLKCR